MTRDDWSRSWKPWLRGTAIGFPLGALPAGGAEIPTFLSYALERRLARDPQRFRPRRDRRRGRTRGGEQRRRRRHAGAAAHARPADLGDRGILLAAFQQYGLQPGPLLFQHEAELVWGLIASLYVGNVMLLVLNLPLVGLWVRLLTIPRPLLYAGILVLASVGAYSVNRSVFDVGLLYAIGGAGYLMRCREIPLAPAIIGVILGPMAEQHRRPRSWATRSPATSVPASDPDGVQFWRSEFTRTGGRRSVFRIALDRPGAPVRARFRSNEESSATVCGFPPMPLFRDGGNVDTIKPDFIHESHFGPGWSGVEGVDSGAACASPTGVRRCSCRSKTITRYRLTLDLSAQLEARTEIFLDGVASGQCNTGEQRACTAELRPTRTGPVSAITLVTRTRDGSLVPPRHLAFRAGKLERRRAD